MKVTLYMAMSLNGIIARESNEEDFLSHKNWETFVELAHLTGCMIWGRKTHEVVKTWEKSYLDEIGDITKVVVTSRSDYAVGDGFERAASPEDALELLEQQGFKSVILTGGSRLNSSFSKKGLIDEVILNVEPVVLGKGIPLFAEDEFEARLDLLGVKRLDEGLVQLHYKVLR